MSTPHTTQQRLLQELTGILPPLELAPLFQLITPVQLEAGELYIRERDTNKKLAFIESGIIRAYFIKDNGDEATLFLRWEGHLIASHDAIIHQQPSRFLYRAVALTSLFEIDYGRFEELLKSYPRLEVVRSYFLMKILADTLQLIESFVLLPPEKRYQHLVDNLGDIATRVPAKHIASALGVTPVSLSRIKKRMYEKEKNKPH